MQNLEALGPRHELLELAKAKADEMMKRVVDGAMKKKTTKKTMQKSKKSKEEEPKMIRDEAPRQEATWEEESAQGKAYFLTKDFLR